MNKIFYNGNIITMDENNPFTESVYVENGIISDIGSFECLSKKYPDSEFIDLKNNTMMPGFIEPHVHFDLCSMTSQMHNISGLSYSNKDDVINEIKKAVKNTPKGRWVMCFGLDYLINRDLPQIDRYWLDNITKEHPLALIIQSMHTMYVNSMALELAHIDRDTKDTRDGHSIKDKNGEPLGILTEQGFIVPIVNLWLKDLGKSPDELINNEFQRWSEKGITTVWTAGYTPLYPDHFNLLINSFNNPKCPLRGDYSIAFNSIENGTVDLSKELYNDTPKSKLTGIKSWYDGSPYTGNMFNYGNYLENEIMQNRLYIPINNNGERLFDKDFFYKMLKKYHNMGYQLSVHAQGSKAFHEVVEIFDQILKENPRKDHRHRLEHCAFIDKNDLTLCGKLGLSISFHPNHLYYYGEALKDIVLGPKLTEQMLPCKTALNNNIKITLHSDAPMYDPNPLLVVQDAVTRTTKFGMIIGADESISLDQALKAVTIDAAWQILRETELGSIEKGKYADFVILEKNPYDVNPMHLSDIKIITTYLNGVDTKTLI